MLLSPSSEGTPAEEGLNAFEPFFSWRAFWIDQEKALGDFRLLQDELDFYMAGREEDLEKKKLTEYLARYQKIWKTLSESKLRHRQKA